MDGISPTHSIAAADIMNRQLLHRDLPHNHSVNIPHKPFNQSSIQAATNNNTLMHQYPPHPQANNIYYDQQQPLIDGPERQNGQLYGKYCNKDTVNNLFVQARVMDPPPKDVCLISHNYTAETNQRTLSNH